MINIQVVKNAIRVGEIVESSKEYGGNKHVLYSKKLQVLYDKNLPTSLKAQQLSIVYFFVSNGIIKKIGQTSGKNGIKGCLDFYCGAGQDDPGQARFVINWLIRDELKNSNKVEVYIKHLESVEVEIEGLTNTYKMLVPLDAKALEEASIKDYLKISNGSFPDWNFQESNKQVPAHIDAAFAAYRAERAKGK